MQHYYGSTDTWLYAALKEYPIEGKNVLVIGSTIPWYEAICLYYKANSCTTIEYNPLQYDHPRMKTVLYNDFANEIDNHVDEFDVIFLISSVEHDGLGRYGDPLNPTGDFEAMAKFKCLIPEGGLMYFAVPTGPDSIFWNAHRQYGPLRYPMLIAQWQRVKLYGGNDHPTLDSFRGLQPVYILRNTPSVPRPFEEVDVTPWNL